MARLLVVDDEANLRRVLCALLGADGHAVTEAGTAGEALAALGSTKLRQAVLTDQKLPDGEGLQIVTALREREPSPPVIVITAFATVELAVEAMRLGAFDSSRNRSCRKRCARRCGVPPSGPNCSARTRACATKCSASPPRASWWATAHPMRARR